MRIGYRQGTGLFHGVHPFTTATFAAAVSVSVFVVPGSLTPLWVLLAVALLAAVGRVHAVFVPASIIAAPFWLFLLLIHGALGGDVLRAVTLGARITTVVLAFLILLATVHPERLVDAMIARGWPFAVAYMVSATLLAVPRLRDRARAILDAQRCRGLEVGGSLAQRMRAVLPLAVPLVIGALAESQERALALETRGGQPTRRTPLAPPRDRGLERLVRWTLIAIALAGVTWAIVT